MKIKVFNSLVVLLLFGTAACNLTKDVEIELPAYDRQPVVECYLEPGKPFRLLLSQSYPFFDPFGLDSSFLEKTLLDGALVTVTYNGQTDTLEERLSFELSPLKVFNYTGDNVVPEDPGLTYELNVVLPDGRGVITGRATMLPRVYIDSVKVETSPQSDTLFRLLTYITDDMSQENFYRRILNEHSLDSFPDQDFIVTDRLSTTSTIAFGTGYNWRIGDTAFNTIVHIPRDYYNYLESVQLAVAGNLNPFAQPSPIKSNVTGSANALGIFTCLVYDRDTLIIE